MILTLAKQDILPFSTPSNALSSHTYRLRTVVGPRFAPGRRDIIAVVSSRGTTGTIGPGHGVSLNLIDLLFLTPTLIFCVTFRL